MPGRGGVRVFIENPRRGVSQERGGGRGAGRVSAGNLAGGGGGGANFFFFFGAEIPTKFWFFGIGMHQETFQSARRVLEGVVFAFAFIDLSGELGVCAGNYGFPLKFIWTNPSLISQKVPVYTSIGP